MASSRWKRFAFFERQALNLPNEVLEDLIPSDDGGNNNNAASGVGRLSLRSLLASGGQRAHTQPSLTGSSAMGDLVSLVVTTAALPASTRSSSSSGAGKISDGSQKSSAAAAAAGTGAGTSGSRDDTASASSLDAMWCTLTACAAPTEAEDSSSRIPVVPLPSQAASSAAAAAAAAVASDVSAPGSSNSARSGGGGTVVDGLVLAFVSSRETELVHCVDLTVRCNPSQQSDSFAASSAGALEELDGWRGYFLPFGGGGGVVGSSQTGLGAARDAVTTASESPPKVVGLACCRTLARQVHLACLAESNVTVWEDPHLHLSCRRPISLPSSRPADAVTYVLPHGLSDGKGCAVDVQPGIVAVGMDVRYSCVGTPVEKFRVRRRSRTCLFLRWLVILLWHSRPERC